ncbi:hypothetical protein C8R43DRAFT_1230415 [Mycena crocata]|nr:hypothetical protein C8R43DRAFT_1230415 [Mycena crocata]
MAVFSKLMPTKALSLLAQRTSTAEDLRTLCERDPSMSLYQPIAASGVEVCAAAKLDPRNATIALAVYAVDKIGLLIHRGAIIQASSGERQALESLEQTLDSIRRHIENLAHKTKQGLDLKSLYQSQRTSSQLKAELKGHLNMILGKTVKPSTARICSQSDSLIQVASVAIRAVGAVCEAPGLNFLKPVVAIAALLCDTAKTVKNNHQAAAELAKHASDVMTCIVDRVAKLQQPNLQFLTKSLDVLSSALEDIQTHFTLLKKRHRSVSWIMAIQERDRVLQLNQTLDKALALFTTTQVLGISEIMQANACEITALALTVRNFEGDVNRTLTTIHRDLKTLLVVDGSKGDAGSHSLLSFWSFQSADLFFFSAGRRFRCGPITS